METKKPLLRPLQVPWMVVPSTPCLRLSFVEGEECFVEFVAFNALLASAGNSSLPGKSVIVATTPPAFEHCPGQAGGYQLIRLVFDGGKAKWNGAFGDSEVIDEAAFDWSLVPDEDLEQFQIRWRDTGTCPRPRCYEVEHSHWLSEISNPYGYPIKHYLICGHDNYAEVLSDSMRIVPGPVLEGW